MEIIKALLIHLITIITIAFICHSLYLLSRYIKKKLNISDKIYTAILLIISSIIAIAIRI